MKDIVIYGIGGMAKETFALIEDINKKKSTYNCVAFSVDDSYYIDGMDLMGHKVYKREWLLKHKDEVKCVCCVGYPKDRRQVMSGLEAEGISFETLIHPTASVSDASHIGCGSIIGAYCGISVDAKLGKGVFLNSCMVSIGHDCILDDYVTCFPKAQISGGCRIGEAALIGSLSYIHEKKRIGREAIIAPGSIVMRNVQDGKYAMGNPAKIMEL